MKVMVILTAFEGADPASGETRTMTIGRVDDGELADDVGRWAHDVVARMLAGQDAPVAADDDDDAPAPTPVAAPYVETTLWPEG